MPKVISILQYIIKSWCSFLWTYLAVIIIPTEGNILLLLLGVLLACIIGFLTGQIASDVLLEYVKRQTDEHHMAIRTSMPTFIIFFVLLLITGFILEPSDITFIDRDTSFVAFCIGTFVYGIASFYHRDEIKEDELKHPGLITKIPQWGKVIISCFWLVITVISLGYIITL